MELNSNAIENLLRRKVYHFKEHAFEIPFRIGIPHQLSVFLCSEEIAGWERERERKSTRHYHVVCMSFFWTMKNRVLQKLPRLGTLFTDVSISPEQTGSLEASSGPLTWSNTLSRTSNRSPAGIELPHSGSCRYNHSKLWNTSWSCASSGQWHLPYSSGRKGWKRWFHRQTGCHHFSLKEL